MQRLDLSGCSWILSDGIGHRLSALVPGSAIGALIKAGVVRDPLYGQEESAATWVDERVWTWQRQFDLPVSFLEHDRIELQAEGLDVLTDVHLGNQRLGSTANRFRTWTWDVRALLRAGARQLSIVCAPATPELRRRRAERALYGVPSPIESLPTGWIRTAACQYGWDWGPRVAGCALRGPLSLLAWSCARLDGVEVLQHHDAAAVDLELRITVRRARPDPVHADIEIHLDGRRIAGAVAACEGNTARLLVSVPQPELWWPRGQGGQPLYSVTVILKSAGLELDRWRRQVGLRKVELVRERDAIGESFGFAINGRQVVVHGANWVPPHPIPERCDPALRERLFSAMVAAHFSMLRIWGGGTYEDESFYERCDELGILVWQDLMLACAHVPLHDEAWVEDFLIEVRDQVRRLRHHACIALWCGNNEFEMDGISWEAGDGRMDWDDYVRLFDQRLPELITALDPQRAWWPCSPHSPLGDRSDYRNPACGDSHQWDVWAHHHALHSVAATTPRFVSEFGFQSLSEIPTLAEVMPSEALVLGHPGFEHRQRGGSSATARILEEVRAYLPSPRDLPSLARASQLVQGIYLDLAIRTWRSDPRLCRGQLYWQLNDTWPCVSWSTVDHRGVWKLSHAMVARAFMPVALHLRPDPETGRVSVVLIDDRPHPEPVALQWTVVDCRSGSVLDHGGFPLGEPVTGARECGSIDLQWMRDRHGDPALLVRCEGRCADGMLIRQHAAFLPPRDLAMADPRLTLSVDADGIVTVHARSPAYAVWVEADGSLLPDVGQGQVLLGGEAWTLSARVPPGCVVRAASLHDLGNSQGHAAVLAARS